ncbi:MAG: alpha/beta fold hydrolase [FCB group bacterium]|nr:alpha/beta fold hydrolase [FCB group bacterium]
MTLTQEIEFNPEAAQSCYVIHGFTSSIEEIRELCAYLGGDGLRVKAENLKGHGTSIDDCNRVLYRDWLQQTEQSVADLMARSEKVYLLGTSMGAVLAMHLASLFPVEKLILSAPTILFTNPIYARYVNPLARYVITSMKKPAKFIHKEHPSGVRKQYNAYPMKAFHQYYKLTELVKREMAGVKCPVFIQYSKLDQRSPSENITFVTEKLGSELKLVKGYSRVGHTMWHTSPDQDEIYRDVLKFIRDGCL